MKGRNITYQRAIQEAHCFIADSEHTKQTLLDNYTISGSNVNVVHLGVGDEYRVIDDPEYLEQERALLGLSKPFLYYPAATWLHKNHANLLSAIKLLICDHCFDGNLVLTGVATSAKSQLLVKIAELGLQDRVHILGYVPYDKLPVIYNLARMLVFPSLYEGFGMPVVEAMACGCPVVCSNVTSLPEVAGAAADYFDPASPEAIAACILKNWNNNSALSSLRDNGLIRAKQFSWEKTAVQTRDVYMRTEPRIHI